MLENFGRFLIERRWHVLVVVLGLTGGFGFFASQIRVESPTIDLFPSTHSYVETFVKYSEIFGGASRVVIQLETEDGDIFEKKTLEKIRRITKELELIEGVNNYQVLSLAQRKIKELKVDSVRGFRAVPVMWPKVPQTAEEIAKLKYRIHTNRRYHGTLVALDDTATLIVAGFFEDKLEPQAIYEKIDEILEKEQEPGVKFHVIGRPIMLGYILIKSPELLWLFIATVVSILLVLLLYFRDLRGVLVPLVTALVSAVWGIGFLGLLDQIFPPGGEGAFFGLKGFNFDMLVIVVPFIISARALSHSVQLIERYLEEFEQHHSKHEAAVATFSGLFKPGVLSIVTDAAGVALVLLTPIPLLQKLALMGGFWVLSILVSDVIFNPVFLSILPAPRPRKEGRKPLVDRLLHMVGGWCLGWQRKVILGVSLVVFGLGFYFAKDLVVGDVHPGTPMLWPDSTYNKDTEAIADKFSNTEEFTVVVEGASRDAIKKPEVLRAMESFQRHMESIPEVGATSSLADLLPGIISILHSSDPRWELIPNDPRDSGFFLEMIFSSSEPGDLVRFVTIDSQNANIVCYLRDHKGETLRRVVAHAKEFIANTQVEGAQFRLAGGYGGLLAAINEEVTVHQTTITLLAFSVVFLFCAVAYRSILAGFLFLVPLAVSNYLTYALMGARGIGLDVNALPVVALGVGLGVDYGLYVVERIKEEYENTGDLNRAILIAVTTAGKAVLFTASTMVFGVVFWAFSFLKFQADMGTLLLFWMIVSMLGGLILLPAIVAVLKPKFIVGQGKPAEKAEG